MLFESLNFINDFNNFENDMILNSLKTKTLVFTFSVNPTLHMCGYAFETVDSYKDLGIIIDKWNYHADAKLVSSRRAFYRLESSVRFNNDSNVK